MAGKGHRTLGTGGGTGTGGHGSGGGGAEEEVDRRWMRRALTLAQRGRGTTRPNPMVGAVVVKDGKRRGEGFHRRAGEPHAEVNALARLIRTPGVAAGATVYVTLEPCCHTGRTAPCAEALISAGVARVVIGVRDPNPVVNGRGIARLRRAGIRVDVGCLEDECRALNRPFFAWVRQRRPLVTLKAAVTLDGFIADGAPREGPAAPVWITGTPARAAAHRLRAEHDAVLVGAGTVRDDNPRLTVRIPPAPSARAPSGRRLARATVPPQPLRVVLAGRLDVSPQARLFARAGRGPAAPVLVVGAVGAPSARVKALRAAGVDVCLLPAAGAGQVDLGAVLGELAKRDIQSLLVEGGARVHARFIAAGLVDRVAFFYAPLLTGGGVPMATGPGRGVGKALRLGPLAVRRLGVDLLVTADVISRHVGA